MGNISNNFSVFKCYFLLLGRLLTFLITNASNLRSEMVITSLTYGKTFKVQSKTGLLTLQNQSMSTTEAHGNTSHNLCAVLCASVCFQHNSPSQQLSSPIPHGFQNLQILMLLPSQGPELGKSSRNSYIECFL